MEQKTMLGVVAGCGAALVLGVGAGFFLPDHYEVSRSATMAADGVQIQTYTADAARWPEWTVWKAGDPVYSTLKVQMADPAGRVAYDLGRDGIQGEIAWAPQPDGTMLVTWTDRGHLADPLSRYVGLVFDGMIGQDLESNLAKLKELAERDTVTAREAATRAPPVEPPSAPPGFVHVDLVGDLPVVLSAGGSLFTLPADVPAGRYDVIGANGAQLAMPQLDVTGALVLQCDAAAMSCVVKEIQ